jgi:hypothetical protein
MLPATGFTAEKSYLCAINEVYECEPAVHNPTLMSLDEDAVWPMVSPCRLGVDAGMGPI